MSPTQDEFDRETTPITLMGETVYEVDAACPLDVLVEICGIEVPATVGGLALDRLGHLAKNGG